MFNKKERKNKKGIKLLKSAGFTLIEMVVVMGMIGIVTLTTLKLVRFSDINKKLTLTTAEIKGVIRTAQTLALAPPLVTDDSDKVLHVCGFVVRNSNDGATGLEKLKIETVLPVNDDPVICRKLNVIGEICDNGTTTTCQPYEEKDFESFKIASGDNPVKIFFRAPYGKVIGAGTVTIQQVDEDGNNISGHSKSIAVNKEGKINVE
jgi:prepilin-type N-terminal cleavage/methylation domain-containing protein